ncbi:MAG: hypothetical protein ACXWJW_16430 [Xanthobacteraceae bacterium]
MRDAVYRGTMVCAKLPWFERATREAIDVTIAAGTVRYTHAVREASELSTEHGHGALVGDKITLYGAWRGTKGDSYESSYSGTFVRRSAKMSGTQTWIHQGGTYTRSCNGVIKRPFAAFLPKNGPQPADDNDDD